MPLDGFRRVSPHTEAHRPAAHHELERMRYRSNARAWALLLCIGAAAKQKRIVVNQTHARPIAPNVLSYTDAWRLAPGVCDGRVSQRPMLVFVHIFKSAGTTTRATLKHWSALREGTSSIRATCRFVSAGKCGRGAIPRRLTFTNLARYFLPRRRLRRGPNDKALCTDGARVAVPRVDVDVVAGHLWFGTLPSPRPAIYVTCLRDPVVLRVSAVLYLRLKKYNKLTLADVVKDVGTSFARHHGSPYYANFVKRLGAAEPMDRYGSYVNEAVARESAQRAARVLHESFAVVGLTEKYGLFIAQLKALLPFPATADKDAFWRKEAARRENANNCKHSTCAVLNALGRDARRVLNETVAYEREVYAAAVAVHDTRCVERLGEKACATVPARGC